jgi:hypothetical protein
MSPWTFRAGPPSTYCTASWELRARAKIQALFSQK